jgi:AraC-like DNA-binding protein
LPSPDLPNSLTLLTCNSRWQADPLGEYRWLDIEGPLARIGDALWIYGGSARRVSSQLLVPHWKACLAVVRQWDSASPQACAVQLSILGPVDTPRWNYCAEGTEIIAVRLHPETAAWILGIEPQAIIDRDMEIEPTAALNEVMRIAESGGAAEYVGAALLAHLRRLLEVAARTDPLSAAAATLLRQSKGKARTRVVAETLGTSERTLRRKFQQHVGLSPKQYARQMRLKHLLLQMDRQDRPNWSALAHDFGYFDQAHLIEDTRLLAGIGPARLHAMRRRD